MFILLVRAGQMAMPGFQGSWEGHSTKGTEGKSWKLVNSTKECHRNVSKQRYWKAFLGKGAKSFLVMFLTPKILKKDFQGRKTGLGTKMGALCVC